MGGVNISLLSSLFQNIWVNTQLFVTLHYIYFSSKGRKFLIKDFNFFLLRQNEETNHSATSKLTGWACEITTGHVHR
jgi:hypothetical protein